MRGAVPPKKEKNKKLHHLLQPHAPGLEPTLRSFERSLNRRFLSFAMSGRPNEPGMSGSASREKRVVNVMKWPDTQNQEAQGEDPQPVPKVRQVWCLLISILS